MRFATIIDLVEIGMTGLNLLAYLPALANRGGSKGDVKSKEKIEDLLKQGKHNEAAEEVLKGWQFGFSQADEFRLLRDVLMLVHGGKLTKEEGYNFMNWLKNCDERKRERFRKAYVSEKEREERWIVIVELATSSPQYRDAYLHGCGLLDKSLPEKALEKFNVPLKTAGDSARNQLPALRAEVDTLRRREVRRQAQTRNNPGAHSKRKAWALLGAIFGNPFAR